MPLLHHTQAGVDAGHRRLTETAGAERNKDHFRTAAFGKDLVLYRVGE
jgi:hypothetical protein